MGAMRDFVDPMGFSLSKDLKGLRSSLTGGAYDYPPDSPMLAALAMHSRASPISLSRLGTTVGGVWR